MLPQSGGSMRLRGFLLILVMILPLLTASPSFTPHAAAADACVGDVEPIIWNETMHRSALVPFEGMYYYDDIMVAEAFGEPSRDKDEGDIDDGWGGDEGSYDPVLHPEDPWMYNPVWPLPTLEPLTTNHYSTMEIGNDSVGILRMNLSSEQRTTFCITLQSSDENITAPIEGDVYLFTTTQYQRYQEHYSASHSNYYWYDTLDVPLSDIPPEWRSWQSWTPYRDVHAYERSSSTTFSLSLDGPEVYDSLFEGAQWEDFYLVVDAWDNSRRSDAPVSDGVTVADITIITTPRTVILPPWTVSLAFFAILAVAGVAPFLVNKRYMGAGLETNEANGAQVPTLEQEAVN